MIFLVSLASCSVVRPFLSADNLLFAGGRDEHSYDAIIPAHGLVNAVKQLAEWDAGILFTSENEQGINISLNVFLIAAFLDKYNCSVRRPVIFGIVVV